jgi:hypothetical protein
MLYVVFLRSPLWRVRRRIWIIRARGRCELCGRRRRLTIHHRTYERLGHERRSDIAVLCWRCHERQHGPAGRRSAWGWPWSLIPTGYRPALGRYRRTRAFRLALLVLVALSALVALSSWIPHR